LTLPARVNRLKARRTRSDGKTSYTIRETGPFRFNYRALERHADTIANCDGRTFLSFPVTVFGSNVAGYERFNSRITDGPAEVFGFVRPDAKTMSQVVRFSSVALVVVTTPKRKLRREFGKRNNAKRRRLAR